MIMDPTPKDVVCRYLDALVARDLDVIRDSFTPDAMWTMHGDLPIAGPWIGRDRITDDFMGTVLRTLFEPGSQQFQFRSPIVDGDTVVLEWRVLARTATGEHYDNEYCGVFTVRDGRIASVREYLDSRYAARVLFAVAA
jgi:uncharacterized protein